MTESSAGAIRFFVDFDGTVAHQDVGNTIFTTFTSRELIENGWHKKLIDSWKAGELTSEQCLSEECKAATFTREELHNLLETISLTAGFVEFAEYCRKGRIPLTILSDGLDYYIEYLLTKFGLSDIDFHSNHLILNDDSIGVSFPYVKHGCGKCGNCKRWHIDRMRRDGERVVYVGDGYSDRYAIRSADVVFARRDLLEYCTREAIDFIPFDNFHQILDYLEGSNDIMERDIPARRPSCED